MRPRAISETVSVAGTDTVLLAANPQRRGFIVANGDDNSVLWLALNRAAAIGSGIRIPPGAPSLLIAGTDWGGLPECEIHAIAELLGAPAPASITVTVWALEACGALR